MSGAAELEGAAYAKLEGLAQTLPWRGCAHASKAYRATIERLGVGASQTPSLTVHATDGEQVGWVSYNGRVWAGDAQSWREQLGARLVYCPAQERQQ